MTEISLTYKLTEDEVASAIRTRVTRNWSTRVLFAATVILGIATAALSFQNDDWSVALTAFFPALVVFGLFYFFYYSPFARARMRNEPRFFIEQRWHFTEDGADHTTEHGESHNAWKAYPKAGETPRFFFLFVGQNMVAPIPKRAFANPDQQTEFRDLLKRKLKLESM